MDTSSISIGTPLKNDKGIYKDEIESPDRDIEGVHVSNNPKLFERMEATSESDEYCMIVDLVLESLTPVSSFKVEHLPLAVVIEGESKIETTNKA